MRKYIIIFAFCLSFVILFGWTSRVALTAKTAPEVKVAITGYDPRDLLAGHYIRYQVNWDKTDCAQFTKQLCPKDRFVGEQRFYIPEEYAAALDMRFRQAARFSPSPQRHNDTFEVVYSYPKNGKPTPKELLINGKDWRKTIIGLSED